MAKNDQNSLVIKRKKRTKGKENTNLNVVDKVSFQVVQEFLAGKGIFHFLSHFWVGNEHGQHSRHMWHHTLIK